MRRFSRDKRFSEVSFEQFVSVAKDIYYLVSELKPGISVEFITSEDSITYYNSTETFVHDVMERPVYTPQEFSKVIWDKAFSIQFTLTDEADPKPFMICITTDRVVSPKSMLFYGQGMSNAALRVLNTLAQRSLFWRIGDGFPKTSVFKSK